MEICIIQHWHLLKDIVSLISSLQSWSFSHTVRHGNYVANALTKRVRLSFPLLVWIESVPPGIVDFVHADLPTT